MALRRRHRVHDAIGARGEHRHAAHFAGHEPGRLEHEVRPARGAQLGRRLRPVRERPLRRERLRRPATTPTRRSSRTTSTRPAGKLTADTAKSIPCRSGTFPQGIAVSPDGSTLLVGQVTDSHVLVFSLAPATYGKSHGQIDVGQADVFEIRFDPNDATGKTAYATMWLGRRTGSDSTPDARSRRSTSPAMKATDDRRRQGARGHGVPRRALHGRRQRASRTRCRSSTAPRVMVVGTVPLGDHGPRADERSRTTRRARASTRRSRRRTRVEVVRRGHDRRRRPPSRPPGASRRPGGPRRSRSIPDGTLYVTSGRWPRHAGLNTDGDNGTYLRGSVQAVPYMDATALAAATTTAEGDDERRRATPASPRCSATARRTTSPSRRRRPTAPSTVIKHVVFIERENKTFDCLFGDLPGVDGDADAAPVAAVAGQHLGQRAQVGDDVRPHGQLLLGRRAIDPGPLLGRLRAHVGRGRAALGRDLGARRVRRDAVARGGRLQRAARGGHLLDAAGGGA